MENYTDMMELMKKIKHGISKKHIKVALISNISFEPYFYFLINKVFLESKISVTVNTINYIELLSSMGDEQINDSDIVVVIPNFCDLYQDFFCCQSLNIEKTNELISTQVFNMKKICSLIHLKPNAFIVWFGYEDYCTNYNNTAIALSFANMLVDKINEQLYNEKLDFIFLDLKRIVATIGINNAYDNKSKYRWNSPYSKLMIEQICNEIYKQYLIFNGIAKKCLVLDCDNVLWGGILSEDGTEKIKLSNSGMGRIFQDFQRFALSLYYHGITLAVCSKNKFSDVLTMFHEHNGMILKEKHIACFQVNWEDKPSNIKKIAEQLNISLDSIVFVDDSLIEIEAVKAILPNVTSILFKPYMDYQQFSCFNLRSSINTTDAENRNETYKTNSYRQELKAKCADYADYIKELNIKIDIHPTLPIEYSRVSELTQRTNRCTNGRRYSILEIKERLASDEVILYSVCVSDCFSDIGLVGAIEIEGDILTLFSLSCQALGRGIEREMMNFIETHHKVNNVICFSTGKNDKIKRLLSEKFLNISISSNKID